MKNDQQLAPLDANQRYTIDETAANLRVSRVRLYRKVKTGDLRLLKDGRRSYVPGREIIAASQFA